MTIDQAIRITKEILDGERGEIFQPENTGDAECIEALETLIAFIHRRAHQSKSRSTSASH